MKINFLVLLILLLGAVRSCDYEDKLRRCCDDNECTGSNCQKGCGMICCGRQMKMVYDSGCKFIMKNVIVRIIARTSCLGAAKLVAAPCMVAAAPTLVFGEYLCYLAAFEVFRECDQFTAFYGEKACNLITDYIEKRKSNKRLLSHSSVELYKRRFLATQSTKPYPTFPENYTVTFATYLPDTVIKTTVIKTRDEKGATIVLYRSQLNSQQETAFLFNFDMAGKTLNLTAGNCSSTRGTYEPLNLEFIEYFKAKLNISEHFVLSSQLPYENHTANHWVVKELLNETRFIELHYFEDSTNNKPLEFKIFLNDDPFVEMMVENFSEEAQIDIQSDLFRKCDDVCSKVSSCQQIQDFPQCGWCPSKKRAFLIDSRNNFPEFPNACDSDPAYGQWTTNPVDCSCLNITKPDEIIGTKNCGWCPSQNRAFIGNEKGPLFGSTCPASKELGQWTYLAKNIKCISAKSCEDLASTDCGWCPSLKKAFLGDFNGPFDGIECPTTEEGQWTYYTKDCKCLTAKKVEDIMGGTERCGWCPSQNRAFIGNEKGPLFGPTCPASKELGQWIYYNKNLKCISAKSCEDLANTDCGWCPSLKKAFLGDFNGPFDGIECPTTEEGQWTYYTKDCKCLTAKKVEDIMGGTERCGWCPSQNRAFIGNEKGPLFGPTCPASKELGQWIYYNKNLKCISAKSCEDLASTDCGWCPSLKKAFLGDFNGPFDGIECPTTEEGQWTYYTKDCKCLTAKKVEDIMGGTERCGWCPSQNRAFIGNEKGPLFGPTCPASKELGQWIYYNKNLKCISAKSCEDLASTDCGWCPSLKKAFLGDFSGPFDGIKCPTTEEGQWTYYTKDCRCLSAKSCEDIQGTNCGWCNSTNKALITYNNIPILNATCPVQNSKKWVSRSEDCPKLAIIMTE